MTTKKSVLDLNQDERVKLFPITLINYNKLWPHIFLHEKKKIKDTLGMDSLNIHHIGSSAVPYLMSKPTLDILVEVHPKADIKHIARRLKSLDYITEQIPKKPISMVFMKGYTMEGYRRYPVHLHLREKHDCKEVNFKNILKKNPKARRYYQRLKLRLSLRYKYDRDAYTEAKTNLIKQIEKTWAK